MAEPKPRYQVGDLVIHWTYGPGTITQFDEKELEGHTNQYYVVRTQNLTVWVPVSEFGEKCLRLPTPADEFKRLFKILSSSGEPLPPDRLERKLQLSERINSGSLEEVCTVVRDLFFQKRTSKMNENDNATLERARNSLLSEWTLALNVPLQQANRELENLLSS